MAGVCTRYALLVLLPVWGWGGGRFKQCEHNHCLLLDPKYVYIHVHCTVCTNCIIWPGVHSTTTTPGQMTPQRVGSLQNHFPIQVLVYKVHQKLITISTEWCTLSFCRPYLLHSSHYTSSAAENSGTWHLQLRLLFVYIIFRSM